jgi:hypothetical protein
MTDTTEENSRSLPLMNTNYLRKICAPNKKNWIAWFVEGNQAIAGCQRAGVS